MSKLKIGYENLLDYTSSYSFDVGSEDADNPFENVYDNFLFDFMTLAASATPYEISVTLDTARSADYISFYKTNLSAAGGSIKLQYWDGAAWEDASSTITPSTTAPVMSIFTTHSASQWKLIIDNNNEDVTIADLKFGEVMTTEHGVYIGATPLTLARDVEYTESKSDTGLHLGRSIRNQGVSTTLDIEFMTDSFLRDSWLPFIQHAEALPFYLAWNYEDYPAEVAYSVTDGAIKKPRHTHAGLLSVNLGITGYIE
jgi:hypothetical protein